jgi:hypothetical protein
LIVFPRAELSVRFGCLDRGVVEPPLARPSFWILQAIESGVEMEVLRRYKIDLMSSSFQFELHTGGLENPDQWKGPRGAE